MESERLARSQTQSVSRGSEGEPIVSVDNEGQVLDMRHSGTPGQRAAGLQGSGGDVRSSVGISGRDCGLRTTCCKGRACTRVGDRERQGVGPLNGRLSW